MNRRLWMALVAVVALLAGPALQAEETYKIDPVHSDVLFKIRHLVSYVTGRFKDFGGTIRLDRENLANSSVKLDIKAASIDTENDKRDEHLRSTDFFDVQSHSEISFTSTKVQKAGGNAYSVTGTFRMHGVSKEITIPVEVLGFTEHPKFGARSGFSTSFGLNRKDYGINWNAPMGADSLVLGEDVQVEINIEAVKEQPEPPQGKAPAGG